MINLYHMKSPYWTAEEDAILKEIFPVEGASVSLQSRLNRGKQGIRHRAKRLGLIRGHDRWTTTEDAILKRYYHEMTINELMPLLGSNRSWTAISIRAQRLGLGENVKWTTEEDDVIRCHYPKAEWEIMLKKLPHRTLFGLKGRGRSLELRVSGGTIRVIRQDQHRRQGNQVFSSYGKVLGSVVLTARHAAEARDIPYPLLDGSLENMQYLDSIAGDKCALSNIPIQYAIKARDTKATASLDRIDSAKGYERGNVQWVHKIINGMKWDMIEEDFFMYCRAVAQRQSL